MLISLVTMCNFTYVFIVLSLDSIHQIASSTDERYEYRHGTATSMIRVMRLKVSPHQTQRDKTYMAQQLI